MAAKAGQASGKKSPAKRGGKAKQSKPDGPVRAAPRSPRTARKTPHTGPNAPPAPKVPHAPHAAHKATPAAQATNDSNLAWLALALAGIPAFLAILYLVAAPERMQGFHVLVVPLLAIVFPAAAIILASVLLTGHQGRHVEEGARTAAIAALVLGIAVVAAWGIPLLIALILLASCYQTSPQPCTCTYEGGSTQACPACPDPGEGCCGSDGGGSSGGGGCCGGGGGGSSGGGGSCCGGGSGGGGASGGGGGGGSCCGSSTESGPVSGPGASGSPAAPGGSGPSVGAPGPGVVAMAGGLAAAVGLRRLARPAFATRWAWPEFAHHPDTPAFNQDVYRVRGHRLCVGCFTTFPVFLAAATVLAFAPLPGPWWLGLAGGVTLAAWQGLSAAGLARRRATKIAVKTALGVGLALAIHALHSSPLPLLVQALALLGLAGLAFASTIPRRRRMAA